jgi:hypothetical protein
MISEEILFEHREQVDDFDEFFLLPAKQVPKTNKSFAGPG